MNRPALCVRRSISHRKNEIKNGYLETRLYQTKFWQKQKESEIKKNSTGCARNLWAQLSCVWQHASVSLYDFGHRKALLLLSCLGMLYLPFPLVDLDHCRRVRRISILDFPCVNRNDFRTCIVVFCRKMLRRKMKSS